MRKLTPEEVDREVHQICLWDWHFEFVLPLKNLYERSESGGPKLGCLWRKPNSSEIEPTVYEADLYTVLETGLNPNDLRELKIPAHTFPNVRAMVEAGWVGD